MQFKETWKAREDGGRSHLPRVADQMPGLSSRVRNRFCWCQAWKLKLSAQAQLECQLSCYCLFSDNSSQWAPPENSTGLERKDVAAAVKYQLSASPCSDRSSCWELSALCRQWAIKAFRYSHTELMKVYKHEVLILTAAMKYDYWNIYFHFKYLFICVLHCWYAYTVWGWNLNSLASSPLGTFLLFALSPALML